MKKVLITGVTGFVGSTLVRSFANHPEIQLVGCSRDIDKAKTQFAGVAMEFVSECSANIINEKRVGCVIHLAGIAHDLSNRYNEMDYDQVNFTDTTRIYNEFLQSDATRFVYLSSIKAVADQVNDVLEESVTPLPATPYGKSKLKAENYILTNTRRGKEYYILRPCMIHGPGNKGNLNLLYKFVRLGIPYPLGAFRNRRSFLSADNLAFIIEHLVLDSIESGIYNLADDGALSTTNVVRIIAETLGRRVRVWNMPTGMIRFFSSVARRRSMLAKLTENMEVSNKKISRAMNKPLPVSLEGGLRKTILSFNE